jgi:xylan 1,4-beta-xylosidase
MSNINGDMNMFATEPVWLNDHDGTIYLRITEDFDVIQFSYSLDGINWMAIGKTFDAKVLSDEFNNHGGSAGFTGNFFAIACHDSVTKKVFADFDYFDYEEL